TPTSRHRELIELATHLVRVAIERDRTGQALRASEQLARTHAYAMMRSLEVLVTETAPGKLIVEMLKTIGQHLGAIRVTFWLHNPKDDSLSLQMVIEDGEQVALHLDHPWVVDPSSWKTDPVVQQMVVTKARVVCDSVERDVRITPEHRRYLTSKGCKRFMVIPLSMLGELHGFIGIHHVERATYCAEEIEFAEALAHHLMIATHTQELAQQQRQAAILEERTRMARDIHDTLAQGFTGVIVQLEAVADAISSNEPTEASKYLHRASELARRSLNEARRSVHALRPEALR